MKFVDRTGQRFGRLVALSPERIKRKVKTRTLTSIKWLCVCDCGKHVKVGTANLGRTTRSCGCLRKDVIKNIKTKSTEDVVKRQVWNYYVRNARVRGLVWELTYERFCLLIAAPCHYCGETGVNITQATWSRKHAGGDRSWNNNGIDRPDNTRGYTSDNTVTACKHCNIAKNVMSESQFKNWISKVYNHLIQEGGA